MHIQLTCLSLIKKVGMCLSSGEHCKKVQRRYYIYYVNNKPVTFRLKLPVFIQTVFSLSPLEGLQAHCTDKLHKTLFIIMSNQQLVSLKSPDQLVLGLGESAISSPDHFMDVQCFSWKKKKKSLTRCAVMTTIK